MKLADISTCIGCGACAQKCPRVCISLKPSSADGFFYPVVNDDICMECGACTSVCPIFKEHMKTSTDSAYAFQAQDTSILKESSSGGLFSTLSIATIKNGGVVFGARFTDDWHVIIDYTETIDGISAFRGSKYVQANVGESYKDVKSFLDSGRRVLFSGTPCQVAGLKSFLNKDYDMLLTIDVICHGVPSPIAWQKYIEEYDGTINHVRFRDKKSGWKRYSTSIGEQSEVFWENIYMKAFLSNLDLRLCCSACSFKAGKSGSDITIGDFWGIDKIKPEIDDDRGLCCVIINSEKGRETCSGLEMTGPISINFVTLYNPSYTSPSIHDVNRLFFFYQLKKHSFSKSYEKSSSQNVLRRIERKLFRSVNK